MTLEGTVVNGVIVPDGGAALPEGSRVRIELSEQPAYPHPMAQYDREKELALLRERIAEAESGASSIPVDEAFEQIRNELKLPRANPA